MTINVPANQALPELIRKIGYFLNDNNSGEINCVKRLRAGHPWPRYHLYIKQQDKNFILNLHVDQKAETRHYNPTSAHNGEYDGPLVEQEINRIQSLL
jgi:protein tyrosine/serine phosphatase